MGNYEIGNFSECSTRERMRYSGKDSERAAEQFLHRNNYHFQRYGLDSSNTTMNEAMKLAKHLRLKPDYICKQLGGEYFLLEVKACGQHGLKIKLESITALRQWKEKMPVMIFVYNGTTKKIALFTFGKLLELIAGLNVQVWDDGKEFYQINCGTITWQEL